MPNVQSFFHKALAVISSQKSTIYTSEESCRRTLSCDTVFQLRIQCVRKLRSFQFFPIQTSIEQKCKRAPLVLHRFVRHKYLREDHSMAQTMVSLSSSYTELFWRTSCFFQKGQSSGIAMCSDIFLLSCSTT